jgi:hypothetical protein
MTNTDPFDRDVERVEDLDPALARRALKAVLWRYSHEQLSRDEAVMTLAMLGLVDDEAGHRAHDAIWPRQVELCPRGRHPMTEDNKSQRSGATVCRACIRERARRNRAGVA